MQHMQNTTHDVNVHCTVWLDVTAHTDGEVEVNHIGQVYLYSLLYMWYTSDTTGYYEDTGNGFTWGKWGPQGPHWGHRKENNERLLIKATL